jgi:3-oxoacyl-[acyl-carrier protein] reductase
MELGLRDHVVFVTGASGGIGRALARAFAAEGARLVLHGHREWEGLVDWLAEQDWRERALPVRADVTAPEELEGAFEEARAEFGRVDHCVANAGRWPSADVPLHELDEARVRTTLEVNLLGALWTARAFLRSLAETGPRGDGAGASLVFMGSTAGEFGERGHADYAAAKAGLVGLMRSLKNEIVDLDPYARVNVVQPGWTVTEMTRRNLAEPGVVERVVRTMSLQQLGRAQDVARLVAFACSPVAARHLDGQVLTLAGGMEGRVRWELEQIDAQVVRARLATDPG